ncbi:hypothetical protein PCE1_003592 [Barthelona sp. PCE]
MSRVNQSQTFAQYVVQEVIGSGSQATVYRCYDPEDTSKEYALKKITLKKNGVIPPTAKREIAIMSKLSDNHPHIPKFYEALDLSHTDDPSIVLVFEHIENGRPLFVQNASTQPHSIEAVRLFMRDLVSTLHFIHSSGVAHRDIKADNILLTETGQLYLIDFGLSVDSDIDNIKSVAGTPLTIAPEAVRYYLQRRRYGSNAPNLPVLKGAALDVWALGVVFYQLLHGKPPFQAKDVGTLFNEILSKPIDIPKHFVKHPACSLLIGMLRRSPEDRFNVDDLIQHPWLTNSGEDPLMHRAPVTVEEDEMDSILKVSSNLVLLLRKSLELEMPDFTNEQRIKIDFHSIVNVINIVGRLIDTICGAFAELTSKTAEEIKADIFPRSCSQVAAYQEALNISSDEVLNQLKSTESLVEIVKAESLELINNVSASNTENEKISELVGLLNDNILKSLNDRASELIVRVRAPEQWLKIPYSEFHNSFADWTEAVTRNSMLTGSGLGLFLDKLKYDSYEGRKHLLQIVFGYRHHVSEILMPPVFSDVVRDLVANSRKYSPPSSTIFVRVALSVHNLHIIVEDKGVGFPDQDVLKDLASYGVKTESVNKVRSFGSGFGLSKAVTVTKMFSGIFNIESGPDLGTRVHIKVPIPTLVSQSISSSHKNYNSVRSQR